MNVRTPCAGIPPLSHVFLSCHTSHHTSLLLSLKRSAAFTIYLPSPPPVPHPSSSPFPPPSADVFQALSEHDGHKLQSLTKEGAKFGDEDEAVTKKRNKLYKETFKVNSPYSPQH